MARHIRITAIEKKDKPVELYVQALIALARQIQEQRSHGDTTFRRKAREAQK